MKRKWFTLLLGISGLMGCMSLVSCKKSAEDQYYEKRLAEEDRAKAMAETIGKQKTLLGAIAAYRKVTANVPNVVYNPTSSRIYEKDPGQEMARLLNLLNGRAITSTDANPVTTSAVYKATHPFLGDDNGNSVITDAYGHTMIYLMDGGVGGMPRIVSAGPDGQFGWEPGSTPAQKNDNIDSDRN
jgi:hypothetical protein